jgi:hypothetical protein
MRIMLTFKTIYETKLVETVLLIFSLIIKKAKLLNLAIFLSLLFIISLMLFHFSTSLYILNGSLLFTVLFNDYRLRLRLNELEMKAKSLSCLQKLNDKAENTAKELRYTIGNISHDLKTVFLNFFNYSYYFLS